MAAVAEMLKQLHTLHQELADAQTKLRRGPLQIKAKETELAKLQSQLDEQRDALRRLKMSTDEKELSLKSGEQKVRDSQVKLNLAKSNKEYSGLQDEIKRLREINGTLEEQVLEVMTLHEEKLLALAETQSQFDKAKAETAKFKETTLYTMGKMEGRLGFLQDKIAEIRKSLPGEVQELYRKLIDQKAERTLAACDNGICQECFTQQTPQGWNDIVNGKAVSCPSCASILYRN